MAGIFPNPTSDAQTYTIGEQVKCYVNEREISPYVGRVSEICPSINKVWVEWPLGGNQQMDPVDLIKVPPFVGQSPIMEESGYSSYDKQRSQEQYGRMGPHVIRLAQKMIAEKVTAEGKEANRSVMASRVAQKFASEVVDRLACDVLKCIEKGMSDVQAYQSVYASLGDICSDGFVREAIERIYAYQQKSAANIGLPDPKRYKSDEFDKYLDDLKVWLAVEELPSKGIEEEKRRFEGISPASSPPQKAYMQ